MNYTIEQQIAAVRTEIAQRKSFYPRWMAQGKMTQAQADAKIGAMQAALETLHAVKAERDAKINPVLL